MIMADQSAQEIMTRLDRKALVAHEQRAWMDVGVAPPTGDPRLILIWVKGGQHVYCIGWTYGMKFELEVIRWREMPAGPEE